MHDFSIIHLKPLGVLKYQSIQMSLSSINISIRNSWSIGVLVYLTESGFQRQICLKSSEYWSILEYQSIQVILKSNHTLRINFHLKGVLEYQNTDKRLMLLLVLEYSTFQYSNPPIRQVSLKVFSKIVYLSKTIIGTLKLQYSACSENSHMMI